MELKPGPFCGGEAQLFSFTRKWVRCQDCFTESSAYLTLEEAIEAWNRRVGEDGKHETD